MKTKEIKIVGVKGFNADMTCRGYQYEEGKEFQCDHAEVCNEGFHFCENPVEVLSYYNPASSVYHIVEGGGDIDHDKDGSKVACTRIKIGARIDIPRLCKMTFDYVRSKCTNEKNTEVGKPATAGEYGAATAGYRGAATAGDQGAATSRGCVKVGKNGIASVRGNNVKVCGGIGAVLLVAEEYDDSYTIKEWKSVVVDGELVKADTWYRLENGQLIECE